MPESISQILRASRQEIELVPFPQSFADRVSQIESDTPSVNQHLNKQSRAFVTASGIVLSSSSEGSDESK